MNHKFRVVLLWDNFGPLHADRGDSVASLIAPNDVLGLELHAKSSVYDWRAETGISFNKVTLFKDSSPRGLRLFLSLIKFYKNREKNFKHVWFLCHYDWFEIFIFALWLRVSGQRVFTMGCSKFDDVPRLAWREWLKSFFLIPYQGAIGSGSRSREYFCFLGLPKDQIVGEYNTVSLARVRRQSGSEPAPAGASYEARHFTIVARLVPKKNLGVALRAYALYFHANQFPRSLHLCGAGPLEEELRQLCVELRIQQGVVFHGFVQADAVAHILATSLILILPSVEEQFGNVVVEAQAMGLPVILSDNCGARDRLVRSGVNGFVIEPDNSEGLAWFMRKFSSDEALWRRMCLSAQEYAQRSDVAVFAEGVRQLAGLKKASGLGSF